MTQEQIQQLFQLRYNQNNWKQFLSQAFSDTRFLSTPDVLTGINTDVATQVLRLGYVNLNENGIERNIAVYDVTLAPGIVLERNRVGLRNLLRKYWKDIDAAFIVYHNPDASAGSASGKWRFTYVSELTGFDAEGELIKIKTEPKRYTYILGEGESCRTAAERFAILTKKGNKTSLDDVKEAFSVSTLTKEFYNELFQWYQWALSDEIDITFPRNTFTVDDDREKLEEQIIRLITRLLFVWFIKQKQLVPNYLFDDKFLKNKLKGFNPLDTKNGNYYNAILQNLFFATLNKPINERAFAKEENARDIKTLYRYAEMFSISEQEIIDLFKTIPFLNGGLFECLDKEISTDGVKYHLDGFSRNDHRQVNGQYSHRAFIPNRVFFDEEKGIIPLLGRYNFTVEESAPDDVQVALDPELLGNVFENLLGAFNKETKESARKQSGSFYTPREIVDFMVNESLLAYLNQQLENIDLDGELSDNDKKRIYDTLLKIKILDPACGSGAFPMGILNGIINLLEKIGVAEQLNMYKLKLHLIENCIYGVDLQTIAAQISKLRFFISLIVEQGEINVNKENYGVITLPNLETKFVAANTLIGIHKKEAQFNLFEDPEIETIKQAILAVRHEHFYAKSAQEKRQLRDRDAKLRKKLSELLEGNHEFAPDDAKQVAQWNPYDQNESSSFFDAEWMFGVKEGFDIVIGNPPYISTKGVDSKMKKEFERIYGFADDTYNHFFFKGIELLKKYGVLSYITPKTFWTTQTKRNLRDLLLSKKVGYIFDTANPFEAAMVDTCVTSVINTTPKDNNILFLDGSKDLKSPLKYKVKQEVYLNTQNNVIFKPTEENMKIYNLYGQKVKELYNQWWDKISTSRNIEKNKKELEAYRKSLKPGDIALLGCLTEGGQGLATANNGKYIAIRKSTKWAKNILESRPKKLAEAINNKKIKIVDFEKFNNTSDFLNSLSESQIAELFDSLKEQYGRDIFGQGYIYRLVDDSEIADVDTLTEDEKQNGIDKNKNFYVPYDKGDKDGNRWYLETPFAIAWHKENVEFLKTNSGKKGVGMPVVRNPQYYFKEGFCWTDVNSTYLKARLKKSGVFDVLSMSLFTQVDIPDWYFVSMINSRLISFYVDNFINNTSHFQINDARQLPIIIPSKENLKAFEALFNNAVEIKIAQSVVQISDEETETKLFDIQKQVDEKINKLYRII
ncbi:MAG: BREX-1 system adenine-specific DNA-methyltransferase PglX [Bacteroidales bacterium]|jgi:hypothetical protein|nr:BREX-1 system adenine-specific DNA-methyltransferase PglX [Bacteroidales bacterium]MDY0369379.1 Eco57I restriction-modification methylase domain-containing protein [Bacteroidales bacterium]